MSIVDSAKSAWHNHPYLIMGAGGLVLLYFLWPSSNKGAAAAQTDPYGQQLAAETALSQAQLAEQASVATNEQNANAASQAAFAAAVAGSNEATAQANAAAITSYNQTAQVAIQGQTALGVAQTQAGSSSWGALVAGLMDFGKNSAAGASDASANGLNAYLTSIGAQFSDVHGPNSFTVADQGPGGTGVSNLNSQGLSTYWSNYGGATAGGGQYGYGAQSGYGANSGWNIWGGKDTVLAHIAGGANLGSDVSAANTPFSNSDNLLGSLWGRAIDAWATNQASVTKNIATPQPVAGLTLAGQIQTVGTPQHI